MAYRCDRCHGDIADVTDGYAPMQGDGGSNTRSPDFVPRGEISWAEHLEIYGRWLHFGGSTEQSPKRMAERGGFSYNEAAYVGHPHLRTWRPRACSRCGVATAQQILAKRAAKAAAEDATNGRL